jgi:protein-L-isoaspartate O-methyltransferase
MQHPMARRLSFLLGTLCLMAVLPLMGMAQENPVTADTLPPGEELPQSAVPTEADTTDKDAPYVATDQRIVQRMLEVADVSEDDVVYDLGSGDGRIPLTAATEFGARGVGVEIDPDLIAKSRAKAEAAGVTDRVEFRQQDLFKTDVSDASVVALYLWPEINVKLRPKLLRQLDPGDRIVSHDFRMGEWEPDRVVDAGQDKTGTATIYLWTVPEDPPAKLMEAPANPDDNR